MLKYAKYLLYIVSRKKAPYIILALFFVLFDITTWIVTKQTNEYFKSNINNLSTWDKFFPFLFATLFIATIVIYVFKQGETYGSELMIVAKPISRLQIIFGKFLVLYIYIFAFFALTTINYGFISFTDEYANISDKFAYAMSLGVGGFVVMIIMSSILVILAALIGKTSLLSFGVVLSAIIPILSFTLSPIGRGQPFRYNFTDSNVNAIRLDKLKNIDKFKNISPTNWNDSVDLKDLNSIFDPETIYIDPIITYEADYKKYKKEMWYQHIAFADIWYQWGRFYSMFQNQNKTPDMIGKWERTTKLISADSQNTFEINDGQNSKYVLFVKQSALLQANKYFSLLPEIIDYIQDNQLGFNRLSLFDRLNFIERILKEYSFKPNIDISTIPFTNVVTRPQEFEQKLTYSGSIAATTYALLWEYNQIAGLNLLQKPTSAYPIGINISTNNDGIDTYRIGNNDQILLTPRMARVGSKIYVYKGKDFINSNIVFGVWLSLAFLFLSGGVFLFLKRDFK